jgi:hypothetical protein
MGNNRRNQRARPDNQQDVRCIGPHDIADRDADRAVGQRLEAGHHFRHGRAEADQSQADQQLRHSKPAGNADRPAHQQLATCKQQDKSTDDQSDHDHKKSASRASV